MTQVLVTGATGTVGSLVADRLLDRAELTVRVASRSPASARKRFDCEVTRFDFTDPTTYRETFRGVDRLFLVRPPAISRVRRDIVPALAAAVGAGVEQVVFLSVLGAGRNRVIPHARIESWLASSDVDTTVLRASFFMQNLTTTHRNEIRDGELFVPAGSGETSFVDARDVADCAVAALTEHRTGTYDITGSAALDYSEVCRILSTVLDREIQYADPSLPRFLVRRYRIDHDPAKVFVMGGIYTTARLGLADRVTDDVQELLGREPIAFESFARDYRDRWKK
ncbi:NAD(P)H-binding protein [Natranaeroarchaeum aerophilus]|uniref:NAD(P)H-binding protein n=1 Tax=Natranaeroarchaeum aerophilus TaxID=2917711 RepID=A0AAE3FPM8_9EURY|nr:NAD(P)H-binding protein [Natranaeroarchaeum aerophilus]MCL9812851.1 NAD(P)H-binding protein [Natranaeroarchaeum aerophilus]